MKKYRNDTGKFLAIPISGGAAVRQWLRLKAGGVKEVPDDIAKKYGLTPIEEKKPNKPTAHTRAVSQATAKKTTKASSRKPIQKSI